MSGAYTDTLRDVIHKLENLLKDYNDNNLGSIYYAKSEENTLQERTNEAPLKTVGSDATISERDLTSPSASPNTEDIRKSNVHLDLSQDPPVKTVILAPLPIEIAPVATTIAASELLAPKKPELPEQTYTNALVWRGKSWFVNNDLTAEKVHTFANLMQDINSEMSKKTMVTKLPPSKKAIATENAARAKEIGQLSNMIDLFIGYVEKADVHIRATRGSAPPGAADALLRVFSDILAWLKEDSIIKLLHIALGYDIPINNLSVQDELLKNVEKLEALYVTDLFKWLFLIKLDEVKHARRISTREISEATAENLTTSFKDSMNFVYVQSSHTPNESQRIQILLKDIRGLQQQCAELLKPSGILSTLTAQIVPSFLTNIPSIVSYYFGKENFLQELSRKVGEYESQIVVLQNALQEKNRAKNIAAIKKRPIPSN